MVPISGEWTRFIDLQDQINHYRLWGLISEKGKKLRPVMVTDGYFGSPEPCEVVGYQGDNWAVIKLSDGYHAIHGEYLAELQPVALRRLPFGVCFVDILARYVVVDIETTGLGSADDRIIEIAAISYEYGKKVAEFQSLVNPEMLIPADITKLTGITQDMVEQAPLLNEIKDEFLDFIGDMPIVGHNALSFDVPFIKRQLSVELQNTVIDTLLMARKVFTLLPCHKLDYLNAILELGSTVAHRAFHDVETTNALLWACLSPRRYENAVNAAYLDGRMDDTKLEKRSNKAKSTKSASASTRRAFEKIDIKKIVPTSESATVSGPLCGKLMVFTGTLSISREEAMQLAVDAGAVLKSSVSAKTNYLVVGRQDITIVGMEGMSTKEEKAAALNRAGKANIQVIDEEKFMELLHTECEDSCEDQLNLFVSPLTENDVFEILRPILAVALTENNIGRPDDIIIDPNPENQKNFSPICYVKHDPYECENKHTLIKLFRICCRNGHHYFGVSDAYLHLASEELASHITKDGRTPGFTNYAFEQSTDGILLFASFLSSILVSKIDALQNEFECCSRFEECSNAKACIHPNPYLAVVCGYRKILKSGRIFFGENRTVD